MNGTEMAVNLCKLLVEDNTEHFDLKATLRFSCQGDISGVLATCCNHMELLLLVIVKERTDCDSSYRFLSVLVLSNLFKCLWVKKLYIAVS